MTIWHLLVGACLAVPLGAALAEAETARAGVCGYLLALLVASVIGPSFALFMRLVHRRLIDTFKHSPSNMFRWIVVALFIAECSWIGAAGFAAWWTVAELVDWVH